jgi:hypothetical protein
MCRKEGWEPPVFERTEEHTSDKTISNDKGKQQLNFSYRYDSPFDF